MFYGQVEPVDEYGNIADARNAKGNGDPYGRLRQPGQLAKPSTY